MSEQNGPATIPIVAEDKTYAVVQTGFITPAADVVTFTDEDGNKLPQLIRVVKDKGTGEGIKTRMESLAKKLVAIASKEVAVSTPLYAVREVTLRGKKARKPMTDEQKKALKERFAKARKRAKGS